VTGIIDAEKVLIGLIMILVYYIADKKIATKYTYNENQQQAVTQHSTDTIPHMARYTMSQKVHIFIFLNNSVKN